MSAAAKSPAALIADLTDQVRLLRQDVGNLTATATTKAEAARLMARIEKASEEAFAHAQEVIDASEHLGRRMHQDSASAAQVAAEKAIKKLEHEIQAAANHMRLESVRGRREAFYSFGGGFGCLRRLAGSGGRSGHRGAAPHPGPRRCTRVWGLPRHLLQPRRRRGGHK